MRKPLFWAVGGEREREREGKTDATGDRDATTTEFLETLTSCSLSLSLSRTHTHTHLLSRTLSHSLSRSHSHLRMSVYLSRSRVDAQSDEITLRSWSNDEDSKKAFYFLYKKLFFTFFIKNKKLIFYKSVRQS